MLPKKFAGVGFILAKANLLVLGSFLPEELSFCTTYVLSAWTSAACSYLHAIVITYVAEIDGLVVNGMPVGYVTWATMFGHHVWAPCLGT